MMVQKFPGVLFLFCVVSLMCGNAGAHRVKPWDYHTPDYGVKAWPTRFGMWCNGTRQSPIDIKQTHYDSSLGNIHFTNYHATPSNVLYTAENDGHTYRVSFSGYTNASHPKINGGGLPNYFKLVELRFHWGNKSTNGSEHHVDGMAYPAELHLVHLNMKYPNVSYGEKHADGLAVLGVFIKQGQHNTNYQFLNLTEHNVTDQGMASNISLSSLMGLLPSNKTFYRYNGSLTTPECQEAVIWTVFSDYIELSEGQMGVLQGLRHMDPSHRILPLENTFRPLQALNDRMVLANFHQPPMKTSKPTIEVTSTSTMTTTSAMNATSKMNVRSTMNATSTTTSTSTMTTTSKMTATDGAYRVSENYFMFLASFCLALLSFLEI